MSHAGISASPRRYVRPWLVLACLMMSAHASRADVARAAGQQNAVVDSSPRLDAIADEAMKQGHVPGMALLEVRNGKVLPETVRGVRAADAPDEVAPGDTWHLGSNAKPMTAMLVARLVESGRLSWSTPLAQLLPSLAATMHPGYRDVTLVDLLSHRSGLPENTDLEFFDAFYARTDPLPAQRLDYIGHALRDPPAVARGQYQYSNTAFLVAAAAAEHATGRSYEALMREQVFAPLGMDQVSFGPTRRGQPLGHEAGKPLTGARADNPPMFAPAGGIAMPLGDWAKFAIDQIHGPQGSGRLLQAASYRLLHTPVASGDERKVALDWGVRAQPFGTLLTHSGSNGYWYAVVAVSPDAGNAVIAAANAAEDAQGDAVTVHALRQVIAGWTAGRD
jgi:CubicO group peptidase (beta-lactamase class C family)